MLHLQPGPMDCIQYRPLLFSIYLPLLIRLHYYQFTSHKFHNNYYTQDPHTLFNTSPNLLHDLSVQTFGRAKPSLPGYVYWGSKCKDCNHVGTFLSRQPYKAES
jgi:hypothetical protein